jgi:hypothetical protein
LWDEIIFEHDLVRDMSAEAVQDSRANTHLLGGTRGAGPVSHQVHCRTKTVELPQFTTPYSLYAIGKTNVIESWIMCAVVVVILCVGVSREQLPIIWKMDTVDLEREISAMTAEVLDGFTLILLLTIHSNGHGPPLIPIDDVPCARATGLDVASEGEISFFFLDHV